MTNKPVIVTNDIWSTVIHDMTRRRQFGITKYGTTLSTNTRGRDPIQNAYEEALDLTVYLKQALLVARGEQEEIISVRLQAASLTEKEREVLLLISRGLSNAEIAGTLSKSKDTVRNQVSAVLRKMNVRTRTEAVLYAVRVGLLQ